MVNDKLQNLQSLSFNINFIGFLFIVVAFTIGKLYISVVLSIIFLLIAATLFGIAYGIGYVCRNMREDTDNGQ